ncbi:ABC transporter permease [Anaerolineales bacterium]
MTQVIEKEVQEVVIQATQGWGHLQLGEVWRYRDLIFLLFWRNLKGRYQQMAFGTLWVILNPIVSTLINTLIFSVIANLPSDDIPYPLFNYAALLPWLLFTGVFTGVSRSLMINHALMKKIYFPRLVFPIVTVLESLLNFVVNLFVLFILMLFYGRSPDFLRLLLVLIPVLVVSITAGTALGLWFAPWSVHYRDVSQIQTYLQQFMMYTVPVIYSMSVIPDSILPFYKLNPMVGAVESFRWALFDTGSPPDAYMFLSWLISLLIMILGLFYFRRSERSIVDIA